MQLFIGHFGTARTALSSKNRYSLSTNKLRSLLCYHSSCLVFLFSRNNGTTIDPYKICATQHIRCTSKSRSISKCWSSWRYCRDTATSHMKCYTDRHSFGAVACQMANIATIPKSEGCKKVPKKFGRNFLGMFSHRMKREISKSWLFVFIFRVSSFEIRVRRFLQQRFCL